MLRNIFGLEKYLTLKDTLSFHRKNFFTVSASAKSTDLFDWEHNRLYILHKDCNRSDFIELPFHTIYNRSSRVRILDNFIYLLTPYETILIPNLLFTEYYYNLQTVFYGYRNIPPWQIAS